MHLFVVYKYIYIYNLVVIATPVTFLSMYTINKQQQQNTIVGGLWTKPSYLFPFTSSHYRCRCDGDSFVLTHLTVKYSPYENYKSL